MKRLVFNPFANYMPARFVRWLLRVTKSELAAANWEDPGGWQSMVISYNPDCRQIADKVLVSAGTMPTALRNRKRLGARLIADMIDHSGRADPGRPVHVLCLGAGPGQIIGEALARTDTPAHATLVDISSDAFDFGRQLAADRGLADRMKFIQADVRDLHDFLDDPPHIVKMLGICEYLLDEEIVTIAQAVASLMPDHGSIVFNSISEAHGTDRFFRRVFGLHMHHRTPKELCGMMAQAGIGEFRVHPEPLGVYHVVVGRKQTDGA